MAVWNKYIETKNTANIEGSKVAWEEPKREATKLRKKWNLEEWKNLPGIGIFVSADQYGMDEKNIWSKQRIKLDELDFTEEKQIKTSGGSRTEELDLR